MYSEHFFIVCNRFISLSNDYQDFTAGIIYYYYLRPLDYGWEIKDNLAHYTYTDPPIRLSCLIANEKLYSVS